MVYHRWQIGTPNAAKSKELAQQLGTSTLLSDLLLSRGYESAQQAEQLLSGETLSSAALLADIDVAVQRIHAAIDGGEKIAVFGDYDVDGVTATALMFTYLDSVGAEVYFKLPNREDSGYGLSQKAIDVMAKFGVKLIITVDNGISACEEIAYAAEKGIDVVVTDHHLPPPVLPQAVAVIDPLRADDVSPAKNLSGVGVAFKVICALEGCEPEEMLPYYGDLVAIGTIADIMLLSGENRVMVKEGLAAIQNTERPGLAALLEIAGYADKPVTAENIGFGISPRLNAAGRMDDATAALQLLLCEDMEEAQELAHQLNEHNIQRQKAEQEIIEELSAQISHDPALLQSRVLVVWGQGYHAGVIGIAASRLLERFGKPTIILTVDEEGNAKGSGRSFAGFSLHSAIASCADFLERYGGHDLAAGLSLKAENLPLLRQRINAYAVQEVPVIRRPPLKIDAPVNLARVTVEDVETLEILAPYGNGNPSPLFVLQNAVIDAVYSLSEGKHTRLRLRQNNAVLYAVMFGVSPQQLAYKQGDCVDAAIYLSVYETASGRNLSGRVKELRPVGLDECYIEQAEIYESYGTGAALSAQQLAQICPSRADVADFYRTIPAEGLTQTDLRPTFKRLGAERTGKILAAADILLELGHIVQDNKSGQSRLCHVQQTIKRPLGESVLLQRLQTPK
ncbi:MAG: single-stranded-DNA-specific exonuclease RecJ [Oscillospiraceae bacterium]|nr:single-stranded-DNA-specific exonuclease RecJ [Oscillospiraceae bacterium]